MNGERGAPGTQPLDRRPGTRRIVAAVAVWIMATVLGLGVAATTKIGPILLDLTTNHGVHLGDVIAFAVAYTAAALITHGLLADRVR